MSRFFLIALMAALSSVAFAQPTGKDIVKMMHDRYAGKWYRSFTFNQTTELHRYDGSSRTETWYEFVGFPDRLRIDRGPADSGNVAIYLGATCYRFRKGKLHSEFHDNNAGLIFLLGGMFFYPLEQTETIFDSLHYDLGKGHEDAWKGRAVYVIGANKGEDSTNQLWIDKENLYLVRMIKIDPHARLEALFEEWKPMGGGWLETKCSFFVDGHLAQVETYHDYKVNVLLDDRLFDHTNLIQSH